MNKKLRPEEASHAVRRPPDAPTAIHIPLDYEGQLPAESLTGAIDLTIETTTEQGEQVYWFDDIWWTDVITRWADEAVTIHIAPTPAALLHPVLLYQLDMLRRVVPSWRLVGHSFRSDLEMDEDIKTAATSPYHEIRIIDATRPGLRRSDRITDLNIESVFSSLRREQSVAKIFSPVFVRMPSDTAKITPQVKTDIIVPNSSTVQVTPVK